MVRPVGNNFNPGGGAAPPAVYDPYQTLISELPLPAPRVSLLAPTFQRLGSDLKFDANSVTDFGKNALPHYLALAGTGKIVLLNVGGNVTADPFGQPRLFPVIFPFLSQSIGIFIFSDVEALAFDADSLISTWQQARPKLKVGFITLPKIQEIETETDDLKRDRKIKDLLSLDELLVSANTLPLEQLIENAYKECRPDRLDNVQGLSEKLSKEDRQLVIEKIAELASGPPLYDVKKYFMNLIDQLGIEGREGRDIKTSLLGDPDGDASKLISFIEFKPYDNGAMPGYSKVLGYLLRLLADNGGGRKMALIVFKYRLITDIACLSALVKKYP